MTEEEFYIELLKAKETSKLAYLSPYETLPSNELEFLENFYIARLYLEVFYLEVFNGVEQEAQETINIDALRMFFHGLKNHKIKIAKQRVADALPTSIKGYLDVGSLREITLNKIESVGSYCNLYNSNTISISSLRTVGSYLDIRYTGITSLPALIEVGGNLHAGNANLTEMPLLQNVGGRIFVSHGTLDYWKSYFKKKDKEHLVTKLRQEGAKDIF